MKHLITQLATDIAQSPATARTVAGLSMGSGIATALEVFSLVIGISVSVAGFALTVLLYKKNKIEYLLLKRDLAEKKARNGAKTRRDD